MLGEMAEYPLIKSYLMRDNSTQTPPSRCLEERFVVDRGDRNEEGKKNPLTWCLSRRARKIRTHDLLF